MRFKPIHVKHVLFAVAALAVLIEVTGVGLRSRQYFRRSRHEDWQAKEYLLVAKQFEDIAARRRDELAQTRAPESAETLQREIREAEYQAEGFRQMAEWSEKKRQAYREAMYRPWSVANPDPPFIHRHSQPPTALAPPQAQPAAAPSGQVDVIGGGPNR